MGHRQKQHLGRNADEKTELPGRDYRADPEVRDEVIAKNEEAREISRRIDENEGYDRSDHRHPHRKGEG